LVEVYSDQPWDIEEIDRSVVQEFAAELTSRGPVPVVDELPSEDEEIEFDGVLGRRLERTEIVRLLGPIDWSDAETA
jgi:hypothetical protein